MRTILGVLATWATVTASLESQQIGGFVGFPWGSSSRTVIAKRGKPESDEKAALGARFITYADTVLSEEVGTFFAFDSTDALMRGGYYVTFSRNGSACETVYRKFQEAIAEHYANIKPDEQRRNSSSLDFCGGVTIGEASWDTGWKADSGAIELWLAPEARVIYVYYDSPRMQQWLKDSKAAEARTKF
jgi:hypothetical protein